MARHGFRVLWLLFALWVGVPAAALAEQPAGGVGDVFVAADRLLAEGKPGEARATILSAMADSDSPAVVGAGSLRLAGIALLGGDYAAAEAVLHDAISLVPASATEAQPALAAIYLQLGAIATARGDMARAQIALLKGIAIERRVARPDDPMLLEAELALATAEIRSFRLDQAGARLQSVAERLAASGRAPDRTEALYQSVLGEFEFRQYHYAEAVAAQQAALGIFARLYGPDHAETARTRTSLAASLFGSARYLDAETELRRAISVYEADTRFFAQPLAAALINLGQLYYTTGRNALALTVLSRAGELAAGSLQKGSQAEAAALLHRGYARLRGNDPEAAQADLRQAIGIWSGPETLNERAVGSASVWLAEADRRLGDFDRADMALATAGSTLGKIFGEQSFAVSEVLLGEGELALARGQPALALPPLREASLIRHQLMSDGHIATLEADTMLAVATAQSGDTAAALALGDALAGTIRQRVDLIQSSGSAMAIEEVAGLRRVTGRLVRVIELALQAPSAGSGRPGLIEDSFALAQLVRRSAAGMAIAGLGERFILGDQDAAAALRAMQEAMLAWQTAERELSTRMAAAGSAQSGDIAAVRAETERLKVAATEIRDRSLAAYPKIAEATAPEGSDIASVQHALLPGEAAIAYLTLEDRSFGWLVTQGSAALVELPAGERELSRLIAELRATVNPKDVQGLGDIRPFATGASRQLYRLLVEPLHLPPDAQHLIIIPDGTLQSLPFAALLSEDTGTVEDFADYRRLAWFIRDHDITILPDIGAIRALRSEAAPTAATRPFLGIGDPVLKGEAVKDPQSVSDLLRMLAPLPESADELEALATAMNSGPESVVTGAAATEAAVKAMALGDYRVLAFATHGLMAGDFGRLREPGLVLTPPGVATGDDDGLLTVREISSLKLDADWVVLSACNTAAGDGSPGAEGLSGLARAFFFAGSRSLLVSQWEVLSVAAVQLTTGTFDRIAADPGMRRSTALQQSILALLGEEQEDFLAHPIFWAPFELVGEGG